MPEQPFDITAQEQQMPPSPFEQQGEQGVAGRTPVPDAPMPDNTSAMLRLLVDNDSTPQKIKSRFYWVHSRDNVLGFLDEDRKRMKLMAFDILKLHALMNTPWYDYTHEEEMTWSMERLEFDTKLDRSLGFPRGRQVNERTVQQSQFSEQRQIMNDETIRTQQPGFFGKMLSFVGKR